MTGVRVKLRFDGVEYEFEDEWNSYTGGDLAEAVEFQWTEGNYSCDCNRSLFINRHCDNAPESWPDENEDGYMKCGDRIELVSLTLIENDIERPIWQPGKYDAIDAEFNLAVSKVRARAAGLWIP